MKNKNGTVISSPPMPNNPAKKPTGKAVSTINNMNKEYSFDTIELIKFDLLNEPGELI